MQQVARFEKVSMNRYIEDRMRGIDKDFSWEALDDDDERAETLKWLVEKCKEEWNSIKLPTRSTAGAAGYDFYLPTKAEVLVGPMNMPLIQTGIRCYIEPGWFLLCVPRSGLGFKYGMRLNNTTGIIDSDYYNAENEGHIAAKLSASVRFQLQPGDRFMQGIFLPYGTTFDDECDKLRTGGFGSTGN